ncbi:precorrin-3B C(17)-methyltransferase [Trinickia dabaoshanensis]|uniref:Precorrin-3B C(17)-methyltransferase n=1 Tax=Trinickia dabaoshanensis TaxID=564714 RepID=A0A2N7VWV7_9BURK|nr:precorrin-3B C(17)-methyltransferase [Trinickia dabaoshanensis]PMS21613.1 precorrin-3B C(17)-methyltransferase [Trinickia dabaoshanensis]
MAGVSAPPAIVVLGRSALPTARRIQAACPGSLVHGLQTRVDAQADCSFTELTEHLQALYARGTPIVALCAAGIVIRCIAPMLRNKGVEPPVLAVAEDGSAVVPLLGGLGGVNVLARDIAGALGVAPAITTSGELRFGTCLLNPPEGYVLADIEQGKHFVSDLLAGEPARIEGEAPWLDEARIARSDGARLTIRVTPAESAVRRDELVIHPRSIVAAVSGECAVTAEIVRTALAEQGLALNSLAVLLAPACRGADPSIEQAARSLGVALRFANGDASGDASEPARLLAQALPVGHEVRDAQRHGIALGVAATPLDPDQVGRARGRLTVVGLGPGCAGLMAPDARAALDEASDILGYETYVKMAGPFRPTQRLHCTDNREELQRARHAFELACEGKQVVVVSSGDPGVFAMASAVFEALDTHADPRWQAVDLRIVPGISAAMATAAKAGAPLGHDFCILSLSDNLKPWAIIEKRLEHAAIADLVMAFYNPISRARPWQLDRALEIVRAHREPGTHVVLGRDIGRPGETLTTTTLGALQSTQVDMRTMVIIGSSTTRTIAGGPHGLWVYTPRWYEA